MDGRIADRFRELIEQGQQLAGRLNPQDYWVSERSLDSHQQWMSSAGNLLKIVSRKGTHFHDEAERLLGDKEMGSGIPIRVVTKMLGTLRSASQEWSKRG